MAASQDSDTPMSVLRLTASEKSQIAENARWLRRVCQPFDSFESMISVWLSSQEGSHRLAQPKTREYYTKLSDVQRTFKIEDANEILTHVPFVATRVESPETTAEELIEIVRKIQTKAGGGKETDCKNLKRDIMKLVPEEYFPGKDSTDSLDGLPKYKNPDDNKAWRGFGHPVTGRLLCPAEHIQRMKGDPKGTRLLLESGSLKTRDRNNESFYPVFVYDESMMDGSLRKGLFRGPLLLKAYRYIFLGRSHAEGGGIKTKGGNAYIHGMKSVKPSTICYAAIQVYVALSAMEQWKYSDDTTGVNLSSLYNLFREQFRHPDSRWCKETLEWWNDQVFPDTSNDDDDVDLRDTGSMSIRERMEQEEAAEMAERPPAGATS